MQVPVLRGELARLPLRPLEDLSGWKPDGADLIAEAMAVLDRGWQRRGFPRVDLAPGKIPWESSREVSRSWSYYIHSWDLFLPLLLAYSQEPRTVFIERALPIALEWIERFGGRDQPDSFAWYDMAVGMRSARLAFLIDAGARLPSCDDGALEQLVSSLEEHRRRLSDEQFIQFESNHGFYQAAGQAAMAKRFSFLPRMKQALVQANERFDRMLAQQFTSEGVHREHSPDYHRMLLRTLRALIDAELFDRETIEPSYLVSEEALSWFVYPHRSMVNFGDSDARDVALHSDNATAKWSTERMRRVVARRSTGPVGDDEWRGFPESGYFVVRAPLDPDDPTHDGYLAFNAAFHSRTHKHSDNLSFVLAEGGEPILIDSGRYGYYGRLDPGSELWKRGFWYGDPARVYVESTRAHNCVEVDGVSHDRRARRPYGSALLRHGQQDGVFFCEGQVYYQRSVRHARVLAYLPGEWLVVFDWLWDNLKRPHEFRQYFTFGPTFRVDPSASEPDRLVLAGKRLRTTLVSLADGVEAFAWVRGRTEPDLAGWWSPAERKLEEATQVAIESTERRPHHTFATLISLAEGSRPSAPSSRISASGRSIHLRWIDAAVEHRLAIKRPEEKFELGYRRREVPGGDERV